MRGPICDQETAPPSDAVDLLKEAENMPNGLLEGLKRLLGHAGPSQPAVVGLLREAATSGMLLHDIILESLEHPAHPELLQETDAVTVIIYLLALGSGDSTGDRVTPDVLNPGAADFEQGSFQEEIQTAHQLRTARMVLALMEVLERWKTEFEKGDCTYFHWQVLKALRLVITPEGSLHVGSTLSHSPWWQAQELECPKNGEIWRRLMQVLLRHLELVGDTMSQKPKMMVLGSLWSIVQASPSLRIRMLQSGGQLIVIKSFCDQVKHKCADPAVLAIQCGMLVTLAAGPRAHQRHMAKVQLDDDVLELLRRFKAHRDLVCGGLALLTLLANDETAAARLKAADSVEAISAAKARWPDDAERAITSVKTYVAPSALVLLRGAPLTQTRAQCTAPPRHGSSFNRSARAAAVCVVGGR